MCLNQMKKIVFKQYVLKHILSKTKCAENKVILPPTVPSPNLSLSSFDSTDTELKLSPTAIVDTTILFVLSATLFEEVLSSARSTVDTQSGGAKSKWHFNLIDF